jgi:hypothetical protein|tara:strand:- start:377 stop:508 length:132 start_codon:yes stop_codon:yes gene_type:complete
MLEFGVDPETPGRLLITLAAKQNVLNKISETDLLTILSLDIEI